MKNTCPHCGTQISDKHEFCPECSTSVVAHSKLPEIVAIDPIAFRREVDVYQQQLKAIQ